jgi:hypothetical protein
LHATSPWRIQTIFLQLKILLHLNEDHLSQEQAM